MKRITIIALLMLLTLAPVSARSFLKLGVKGGISLGSYDYNRGKYGDYNVGTNSKVGFHVGIVSRLDLFIVNIQPELYFSHHRYDIITMNANKREVSGVRMNTLDLPILFGVKLLFMRFQLGPVFNLLTDTSINNKGSAQHTVTLSRSTISYMLGIGFDIGKVGFDLRYNGNFKRPRQYTGVGTEGFMSRMKFRSWMFSAAYMF